MFYRKKQNLYTKIPKKKLSFLSISFVVLFSFLSFEVIAQTALRERIERQIAELERQIRELENLSNTCRFAQSILQAAESEAIDFSESITPELREEDKKKLIALREERGKECLSAKQKVENSLFKNLWKEASCFFSDNTHLDETPEEERKRETCHSNTVKNDGCYTSSFLQGPVLDQNCARENKNKCLESYWKEVRQKKSIADRVEEYKKIAAKEELFQAIHTEGYYKELFPDTIETLEENCKWIEGVATRRQQNSAACREAKEALKSKISSIEDKDFYEKNLKAWEEELQEKLGSTNLDTLGKLEKSVRYCIDEGNKGFNKTNCKDFAHKPSEEDKEHEALEKKCKESGAVASVHAFNSCMSRGTNARATRARVNAIIAANKEYFEKLAERADILQSPEETPIIAAPVSNEQQSAVPSRVGLTTQSESSTAVSPQVAERDTTLIAITRSSPPPVDTPAVTAVASKACSKEYKETLRVQERFQDFLDNCIVSSTPYTTEEEKLLKEKLKEILSSKEIDEEHIDPLIETMLEEAKKEKGWSLSRSLVKMESESGFKQGAQNTSDGASTGLMQVYTTDNTEGYLRGLIDSNNIEYPDSSSSLKNQLLDDPIFNYKVAAALNRSSRIKSAAGREAEYLVACTKTAATCKAIKEETDTKKALTLLSPPKAYRDRDDIGWSEESTHALDVLLLLSAFL